MARKANSEEKSNGNEEQKEEEKLGVGGGLKNKEKKSSRPLCESNPNSPIGDPRSSSDDDYRPPQVPFLEILTLNLVDKAYP